MTEEKNENEELKELFSDFAHKVLDRAIEYRGKFEEDRCRWILEKFFRRNEKGVTASLERSDHKDLIEDWKKLKQKFAYLGKSFVRF